MHKVIVFLLTILALVLIAREAGAVTVAVIDTGLSAELPHVLPGWSFVRNNKNTADVDGHGTHVSGIISRTSPEASLLPIQFFTGDESERFGKTSDTLVESINYAVSRGVNIINFSGGGPKAYPEELAAIVAAGEKGILLVVAAGNEAENMDEAGNEFYPCSYGAENVICVANVDAAGRLSDSSNWGVRTVDVAAPGVAIVSNLPGGRRGAMTGTSMSAARVSGVAANALLRHPGASVKELKRLILESAEALLSLGSKIKGGRVLFQP